MHEYYGYFDQNNLVLENHGADIRKKIVQKLPVSPPKVPVNSPKSPFWSTFDLKIDEIPPITAGEVNFFVELKNLQKFPKTSRKILRVPVTYATFPNKSPGLEFQNYYRFLSEIFFLSLSRSPFEIQRSWNDMK